MIRYLFSFFSLIFPALSAHVFCQQSSNKDITKYVWDFSGSYYSDFTEWDNERKLILSKLSTIEKVKGTLGRSSTDLADGLDKIRDLRWRAHKLSVYGFLYSSVNTQLEQANYQKNAGTLLESEVESAISFVENEVHKIGAKKLNEWLISEPRLRIHRRTINYFLFTSPWSLDEKTNKIVSNISGRWPFLAGDTYLSLMESDLDWPTIERNGAPVQLTPSEFGALKSSPDTALVRNAKSKYFKKLKNHESTFGLLLTRRIEADEQLATYKKFKNGIDALFFLKDGLPEGSFQKMLDYTKLTLPTLQKYLRLRNSVLGVNEKDISAINITAPGLTREFPIDEAQKIVLQAFEPMGKEYLSRAGEIMKKPWFHLSPSETKRVTYGIYWPIGKGNSYTIMDYRNRFSSSRAYAGAVMLTIAYESISKNDLPGSKFDPPIYSNAILYVGNILHDDYLVENAQNKKEKIAYLISALDRVYRQYFQYLIMGELELKIAQLINKKEPPGGQQISMMYSDLLKNYFGFSDSLGVDKDWSMDWINNSNLFFTYEHLFWPPSMAAACYLSEKIRNGDTKSIHLVEEGLKNTDIFLSDQIFKKGGIDLTNKDVYLSVERRMDHLLQQLEKLLAD